ncbi:MAG TPA: hypothetical protein VJ863_10170 [Sphaerochaeta sp.]|nr:hypothetical protein [Sphaerochaeta sp.]
MTENGTLTEASDHRLKYKRNDEPHTIHHVIQRGNNRNYIYGGRYKSYLITENQKLYSSVRYIVQNPVKEDWSSFLYSIGSAAMPLLGCFSSDGKIVLTRYIKCTEHASWNPKVGFATIIERKTEERLAFLLDKMFDGHDQTDKRKMLVAGSASPLIRDFRSEFIQLAIADAHALKDIASFLHVSHETVRRIGKCCTE